jgi:hypothetical protein
MAPHFAQMLTEPDETLFSHGACHVFAQVLQEHFGYQLVVLRRLRGGANGIAHAYCRFTGNHNLSVDVVGISLEHQALRELGWEDSRVYRPTAVSAIELTTYFTTSEGKGFYAETDFLRTARERAEARIRTYEDYYSGKIQGAIPGAGRTNRASPSEINEIFSFRNE